MKLPKDQHCTAKVHSAALFTHDENNRIARARAARSLAGYRPTVGDCVVVHRDNRTSSRRLREGPAVVVVNGSMFWLRRETRSVTRTREGVDTAESREDHGEDRDNTWILHTKVQVLRNRMKIR